MSNNLLAGRLKRRAVAIALVVTSPLGIAGVAVAANNPSFPTQQQVDAAKAQVAAKQAGVNAIQAKFQAAQNAAEAAANKAEVAAEAYNLAQIQMQQAQEKAAAAQAAAAAAQSQVDAQRQGVASLVAASYQDSTQFNTLSAVIGAQDPQTMLSRAGIVTMAGQSMKVAYDRYVQVATVAQTAQAAAAAAVADQQSKTAAANNARNAAASAADAANSAAASVAAQRNQLVQQLAAAQNISTQLAAQRQAALEAQARAAAEAAAQAAAAARARAAASAPTSSAPSGPLPPVSGNIATVIAFAKAQLGKPYQWGGAGPNTWDCSGLTMVAFQQIGINMPHYATYQYTGGRAIPVSAAQPGDLIFWSSDGTVNGIHHVALYLGNGQYIEAPHTGALVRYNSYTSSTSLGYPDYAARIV